MEFVQITTLTILVLRMRPIKNGTEESRQNVFLTIPRQETKMKSLIVIAGRMGTMVDWEELVALRIKHAWSRYVQMPSM